MVTTLFSESLLQEREIHKLGSDGTVTVDVRVLAATNVHLEQYVKYKKFR
ncbi:MAG TPA: sigma 54-interacting transcriptional regulator, partial [Oscillatoriaceae cyanobacterium M33_DOE_052]|nr:sigma 54-interacting transcriptional regulator [Oscillatoriaceae cyanobacterium M33_DOE_052]